MTAPQVLNLSVPERAALLRYVESNAGGAKLPWRLVKDFARGRLNGEWHETMKLALAVIRRSTAGAP